MADRLHPQRQVGLVLKLVDANARSNILFVEDERIIREC